MIINKAEAWRIGKETLAEMAESYANSLREKLGAKCVIEVKPGEIIADRYDAVRVFCNGLMPIHYLAGIADEIEADNDLIIAMIANKEPFFKQGIAYTPLSMLSSLERRVVREAGKSTSDYLSLKGFGAEIGHLVAHKLYNCTDTAIGEALDTISSMHEISINANSLGCSPDMIDRITREQIDYLRKLMCDTEELLFGSERMLKLELFTRGYNDMGADSYINELKTDFVRTRHYEGLKIFLAAIDAGQGSLDAAFRRMHNALSCCGIRNFIGMIAELDVPLKEIERLAEACPKRAYQRARKVNYSHSPRSFLRKDL